METSVFSLAGLVDLYPPVIQFLGGCVHREGELVIAMLTGSQPSGVGVFISAADLSHADFVLCC